MATIGTKVLNTAADMLREHLHVYGKEIEQAYFDMDDALTINLGIKLAPGMSGVEVITTISFVTGKIKDSGLAQVDEEQMDLPIGK